MNTLPEKEQSHIQEKKSKSIPPLKSVMTATALHTSLTATETTFNDVSRHSTTYLPQSWTCNNCCLSFETSQAQREHMKSSWHVYNLKRRIASLSPISMETYKDRVQTDVESVEQKCREEPAQETDQDTGSPNQCLFCPLKLEGDTECLENTIEHMFNIHGLFIPGQAMVVDLECFLGYLSTTIRAWHECLYCGITRTSTQAIQSHMRDSGHCMLNLEREPELMEFWERTGNVEGISSIGFATPNPKFEKELQLSTGKMVVSRRAYPRRAQAKKARDVCPSLRAGSDTQGTSDSPKSQITCQLARRDEMGIQNINPQQRNSLFLAHKRSQKAEAVATRAKEWSYARRSNDQKHDQAYGPLSWAKGGMHNLLPR